MNIWERILNTPDINLPKNHYTKYELRYIDHKEGIKNKWNYSADYPIIFKTREEEDLNEYMNKHYPDHRYLPQLSPELREYCKKHGGYPLPPHIQVTITPLHNTTYYKIYAINE